MSLKISKKKKKKKGVSINFLVYYHCPEQVIRLSKMFSDIGYAERFFFLLCLLLQMLGFNAYYLTRHVSVTAA